MDSHRKNSDMSGNLELSMKPSLKNECLCICSTLFFCSPSLRPVLVEDPLLSRLFQPYGLIYISGSLAASETL